MTSPMIAENYEVGQHQVRDIVPPIQHYNSYTNAVSSFILPTTLPSRRRPHPNSTNNNINDCPIQAMKRLRVVDNTARATTQQYDNSNTLHQSLFQETGQDTMSEQNNSNNSSNSALYDCNAGSTLNYHQQQYQNRTPVRQIRHGNNTTSCSTGSINSSSKKKSARNEELDDDGKDSDGMNMMEYHNVNFILGNLHLERQQRSTSNGNHKNRIQNHTPVVGLQQSRQEQQDLNFLSRRHNIETHVPDTPWDFMANTSSAAIPSLMPSSESLSTSLPLTPINSNRTVASTTFNEFLVGTTLPQNQMYNNSNDMIFSNHPLFPKSPPPKPNKQKRVIVLQTDSKLG